jgi:hypothetical protein
MSRPWIVKRSQEHTVDDRNNCGIYATCQGECEYDDSGKSRCPAKGAHSVPQIAQQILKPRDTALIANTLH